MGAVTGTKPLGRGEPYLEWGADRAPLQKATSARPSPGSHASEPLLETGAGPAPGEARCTFPTVGSVEDKKPKLPEDML